MDLRNIFDILTLLDKNEAIARCCINMVASENSMSGLAKLPLLLDIYHRYFFNEKELPDRWVFRGAQEVGKLETQVAVPLLQELTGAAYVTVRPLSGLNNMLLVLSALGGDVGSVVMTVSTAQGGHYATASIARRLGLQTIFITGPDAHSIDYDDFVKTLRAQQPALIYIDQSNCLFPIDVELLTSLARKTSPHTLIHVDTSHWMGLILGGQLANPLACGADSFGGSMHKTFPGPQKAIFATSRQDLAARVLATQDYLISSHHFGATVSLALALLEFKQCNGAQYAAQVISNTQTLARCLYERGLDVQAANKNFSRGHQIWIRTATGGVDGVMASDRLYAAGIRVNALPDLPGIAEVALRVGVNEATFRGLQEKDMAELADIFVAAIQASIAAESLAERVCVLRARYHFPYSFPTDHPDLLAPILQLVMRVMAPDATLDVTDLLAFLNTTQQHKVV